MLSGVYRTGINPSTAVCLNEDLAGFTRCLLCLPVVKRWNSYVIGIPIGACLPLLCIPDQNCIIVSAL